MSSKIFQKLLMLDNQAIAIQNRSQHVAQLCKNVAKYFLDIVEPINDGDPMVDTSVIDLKNAYAHAKCFNKKIVFRQPKKAKVPKTNAEFAKELLDRDDSPNPNFLFDSKITFNVATDFQSPENGENLFEQFGLSFKLCPAGIYQRPVEIHHSSQFMDDPNNPSKKILKIFSYAQHSDNNQVLVRENGDLALRKTGDSELSRSWSSTPPTYQVSELEKQYSALLGDFQVQISNPFWVLDAEVTTQLFEKIMGYTYNPRLRYESTKDNPLDKFLFLPEDNVDWDVAILFCNRLSQMLGFQPCYLDENMKPILSIADYYTNDPSLNEIKEKSYYNITAFCRESAQKNVHYPKGILPLVGDPSKTQINWDRSANGFRLLSDVEWIWACQGLSDKPYAGSDNLDDVAWYGENSGNKNKQAQDLHIIKEKQANSWGLYDMLGNVSELCFDFAMEYKDIDNPQYSYPNRSVQKMFHAPIWNMDRLQGLANSFRKDYYFGKPQDVSILQSPNYTKKDFRKHMGDEYDFSCRISNRWRFVTHGGNLHTTGTRSVYDLKSESSFSQLSLQTTSSSYLSFPDQRSWRSGRGFRICKNVD